jgi:hypothetical protein
VALQECPDSSFYLLGGTGGAEVDAWTPGPVRALRGLVKPSFPACALRVEELLPGLSFSQAGLVGGGGPLQSHRFGALENLLTGSEPKGWGGEEKGK